jgi:hypothetical protein
MFQPHEHIPEAQSQSSTAYIVREDAINFRPPIQAQSRPERWIMPLNYDQNQTGVSNLSFCMVLQKELMSRFAFWAWISCVMAAVIHFSLNSNISHFRRPINASQNEVHSET